MNARTQISLDPEVQKRAHAKAAELGISFAEYVRRLVALDLGPRKRRANVSALFDLGASAGATDVARDKDAMIAGAVLKDYARSVGGPRKRKSKSRKT